MPDENRAKETAAKKPIKRLSVNELFLRVASLDHKEVSEEEVEYFRAHPDQIDQVSSPLRLHKLFLWAGMLIGALLVGISKLLDHSDLLDVAHPALEAFVVDIVFEIGVALIGAAIVTFMIGIALNQQQASAKRWRKAIRKRIEKE